VAFHIGNHAAEEVGEDGEIVFGIHGVKGGCVSVDARQG
jgi:hypothetical protein